MLLVGFVVSSLITPFTGFCTSRYDLRIASRGAFTYVAARPDFRLTYFSARVQFTTNLKNCKFVEFFTLLLHNSSISQLFSCYLTYLIKIFVSNYRKSNTTAKSRTKIAQGLDVSKRLIPLWLKSEKEGNLVFVLTIG